MRVLPARRLASSALCAVLLTAVAAPTALAADADQAPRQGERSAPRAPLPGADALLAQVKSLGDAGGVLAAVAPLLDSALKADKGQLPKEQATQLATAAKDAIQKASAATPTAPAAPAVPATPAAPSAPGAPGPGKHGKTVAAAIADVKAEALNALGTSVDTLAAATTSGDAAKVAPAAGGVVAAEVNVLAATLLGGGLPAPNLPGLPKLPNLPAAAPAVPAAPSLPAAPNPVTG
ncbi:hypothetical protein [Streptomyces sp. ACT015]|uniref:hypothetical protein n=1 Tax=Streptomyces sp. ACT015 TaxID=3134807 RepID=UPI003D16B474